MIAGIFSKFAAFLSICPEPVIGGFYIVSLGMITAVGFSCFQFCDMTSVRNLVIIGSSIMLALMLPYYMAQNPGNIDTGIQTKLKQNLFFRNFIKLVEECNISSTCLTIPLFVKRYNGKLPLYVLIVFNPTAGSEELDQIITILLSTAMCVGGITAFTLDNIVRPGKDI